MGDQAAIVVRRCAGAVGAGYQRATSPAGTPASTRHRHPFPDTPTTVSVTAAPPTGRQGITFEKDCHPSHALPRSPPSGDPADGYTIVGDVGEVTCNTEFASPSAVSPTIYSCAPSAASADLCWPTYGSMLCAWDPWGKELRRAHPTNPMIPPVSVQDDPQPWALELTDGTRCRIRNGGAWGGRADGLLGAYSCERDWSEEYVFVLTHADSPVVDTSTNAWTVLVGGLGAPSEPFPPPGRMTVKTAWFAAQ